MKCDDCKSGLPNNQNSSSPCQFIVDDINAPQTSHMFTNTSSPGKLTLKMNAIIAGCKLTVLAIGGGNQKVYSRDSPKGGNCGRIALGSFDVHVFDYQVIVGSVGQHSRVKTFIGRYLQS